MLLMINLSETEITNGKIANGSNKSQYEFIRFIYTFLSISLRVFVKL